MLLEKEQVHFSQGKFIRCKVVRLGISAVVMFFLSGCAATNDFTEKSLRETSVKKKKGSIKEHTQGLRKAQGYFNTGQFGNAERAFRLEIEKDPFNVDAWLGIAATYDRIKKYSNANNAYMIAVKLKGYTPDILNNLGYHYILRKDFSKARKALEAANQKDPGNPYIRNNLEILKEREATRFGSGNVPKRKNEVPGSS